MRTRGATGLCLVVAFGIAVFGVASARETKHRPVMLGHGTLSRYEWSVVVARDGGKRGGQRPCFVISRSDARGSGGPREFSGYTKGCTAPPNSGSPFVLSDTAGEGSREMAIFVIAFTPKVASAYLDFGSDGHMRVRLKRLNSVQQRNAGVRPLRYVAFALKGDRCLREVKGYSAAGSEIFSGPIDECSEAGE